MYMQVVELNDITHIVAAVVGEGGSDIVLWRKNTRGPIRDTARRALTTFLAVFNVIIQLLLVGAALGFVLQNMGVCLFQIYEERWPALRHHYQVKERTAFLVKKVFYKQVVELHIPIQLEHISEQSLVGVGSSQLQRQGQYRGMTADFIALSTTDSVPMATHLPEQPAYMTPKEKIQDPLPVSIPEYQTPSTPERPQPVNPSIPSGLLRMQQNMLDRPGNQAVHDDQEHTCGDEHGRRQLGEIKLNVMT